METNNVQETLEKGVKELYKKLEENLPEYEGIYNRNLSEKDQDALITTTSLCGRDFPMKKNTGIAFYGRFNNGWDPNHPLTMDDLPSETRRPFFNLMRHISEHYYPESWNTHVVWSNMCKVGPASGGNPTEALWDAHYNHMVAIFNKEMEILSPKVVVLITGNLSEQWDAPLFEGNDLRNHMVEEKMWAANGKASLYKKDGRLYIVTDRPEYKAIMPHVDCIIDMIERNK